MLGISLRVLIIVFIGVLNLWLISCKNFLFCKFLLLFIMVSFNFDLLNFLGDLFVLFLLKSYVIKY